MSSERGLYSARITRQPSSSKVLKTNESPSVQKHSTAEAPYLSQQPALFSAVSEILSSQSMSTAILESSDMSTLMKTEERNGGRWSWRSQMSGMRGESILLGNHTCKIWMKCSKWEESRPSSGRRRAEKATANASAWFTGSTPEA